MRRFRSRPFAAVLVTAAVLFLLQALWIPAKARLAQALLERAWSAGLAGAATPRPWPWADTRPVAVLEAPRLGVRQLVLEGASGRNLAFGPAALTPIEAPDLVLSGHRDTHFAMLEHLRAGDLLRLTRPGGDRAYRVRTREVVDSRLAELVLDPAAERLTLVTCWPFDAAAAGGPLRLVVTAEPVGG